MGRQKGLFPVTGTLGRLNFYMRKGVPVVRVAGGGFNGKAIKTQPNMQRVRENSSEFGHCTKAKKMMRTGLQKFLGKSIDFNWHGNMVQLMTRVKDLDSVSDRGKRRVDIGLQTDEGKKLLLKHDYNPKFNSYYFPNMVLFDLRLQTVQVSGLNYLKEHFPTDADAVRIEAGLMPLNFEQMQTRMYLSAAKVMERGDVTLNHTLTFEILPDLNGWGMVFLHIQFMRQNGDHMEYLPNDKWNGIRAVWIGEMGN